MVERRTIHVWLEDTAATRRHSKQQIQSCILSLTRLLPAFSASSSTCVPSRSIVTTGNVLLVQFVSDLSVTLDGFLAHYTSIRPGSYIPTETRTPVRSIPPKPAVKPSAPERPATTTKPPAPRYIPTERPRPVKPTRGRRPETTGQDRRVPVTRPNGKRPGGSEHYSSRHCSRSNRINSREWI